MKLLSTYSTAALLLFVLFVAGCSQSTPDYAWLYGTWNLAHNPAMDDEDILVFKSGGRMEILTKRGGRLSGIYEIKDGMLNFTLNAARKVVESSFAISEDKSQLVYSNGAYYTKQD